MKIALICPSNLLYMPYVNNYETILKEKNVNYDIINWDRFNIEDKENPLTYRDLKVGHQRNFFDYYKYKKFIIKKINTSKYDKIIVFGVQLTFFLKRIMKKKYKANCIIDIRDYNRILEIFRVSKVIENSSSTVLSSPGFREWLPKSSRYIINHNTVFSNLNQIKTISSKDKNICKVKNYSYISKENIIISYIGSIRDYEINIDFIDSLKESKIINLHFHGEGVVNKDIIKYLDINRIKNVKFTGRYEKLNEEELYMNSDLINILIPKDDINSKTLLPNRLYHSVIKGKPIIAFDGTFLSTQVKKYNLGLVLNSFNKVENQIMNYLDEFDIEQYEKGRRRFLNKVIKENMFFDNKIIDFIK